MRRTLNPLAGTERTYERAGACLEHRVRAFRGEARREGHGPVARPTGACEGTSEVGRRREGPEEIGAAQAAKTTRGLFRVPPVSSQVSVVPRLYGRRVYGRRMNGPGPRDLLLADLDPSQLEAVT